MNRVVGKAGAFVTGAAVLAFAVSMFFKNGLFAGCFSSMFIAIGFVAFMCSLVADGGKSDSRAAGYAGIAFAAIYATIVFLVYYAECTTVRMNPGLGNEALSIISYGKTGSLFFNYDLLGYAFMALSTFLTGFAVEPKDTGDKAFRCLLWIHGIFFLPCLLIPLFPLFREGTNSVFGVVILEFWCVYFLPVCILGYRYFSRYFGEAETKR